MALPSWPRDIAYGAGKASEDVPHGHHADIHDGPVHLGHETLDGGLARKQALRKILPVQPLADLARQMRQRVLGNDHLADEICQPVDPLRIDAKRPCACSAIPTPAAPLLDAATEACPFEQSGRSHGSSPGPGQSGRLP